VSAARVAKLEALLGRVARNRRPLPARSPATPSTDKRPSLHPPLPTHAVVTARAAPEPAPKLIPVAPIAREPEPILAPPPIDEMIEERPPRAVRPTPMEQAVNVELEAHAPFEAPSPSSVDVEITLDDEGTELTVEAGDDEGIDSFEGDALLSDSAPTAPVEMRAPQPTPIIIPAEEPEDEEEPSAEAEELFARPIELPPAKAAQPVAKSVSRQVPIEPETFGELLDRTLALRPR
jgi:hypothetical protein